MVLGAGAFLTISSAMPPSVTTSARFFISIGVTEVIGSTPSTSTSDELLDEGQDGVELAPAGARLVVGDRDAREMRDAAHGVGIDGHGASSQLLRALARRYSRRAGVPDNTARRRPGGHGAGHRAQHRETSI